MINGAVGSYSMSTSRSGSGIAPVMSGNNNTDMNKVISVNRMIEDLRNRLPSYSGNGEINNMMELASASNSAATHH